MQRIGRNKDPHFRVIVTERSRGPRSGKYIEALGSYNAKLGQIDLKEDRIKYWLSVGANPSATVHNILVGKKILTDTGKKRSGPLFVKKEKEEVAEENIPASEDTADATAQNDDEAKEGGDEEMEEETKDTSTPDVEETKEEDTTSEEVTNTDKVDEAQTNTEETESAEEEKTQTEEVKEGESDTTAEEK